MSVAIVANHQRDFSLTDVVRRSTVAHEPDGEVKLRILIRMSEEVWFGLHNDRVAAVWGLIPPSLISNRAYLWLLTTDLVDEHKFVFIRHSQLVIEDALKRYAIVVGHVEVGNYAARKWLRWLGAEIGIPEKGFSPFVIRRK
jgi:hypothetical protein